MTGLPTRWSGFLVEMIIFSYLLTVFLVIWATVGFQRSASELNAAEYEARRLMAFHIADGAIDSALAQWNASGFDPSLCDGIDEALHAPGSRVRFASGHYAVTTTYDPALDVCRIESLGTSCFPFIGASDLRQCLEAYVVPSGLQLPGQLIGQQAVIVGWKAKVEGAVGVAVTERIQRRFTNFEGLWFRMGSKVRSGDDGPGRLIIPQDANPYQLIKVRGIGLAGAGLSHPTKQAKWRTRLAKTLGTQPEQVFDQIRTVDQATFDTFFTQMQRRVIPPDGLDCSQELVVAPGDTETLTAATQCFSSITVQPHGHLIVPKGAKVYIHRQTGELALSLGVGAQMYSTEPDGLRSTAGFELRVADERPVHLKPGSDFYGAIVAPYSLITLGFQNDTVTANELGPDPESEEEEVEDREPPAVEENFVAKLVGGRVWVRAGATVHLELERGGDEVDPDAGTTRMWRQLAPTACDSS